MPNSKLIVFIKKARQRGFDDYQIRQPLLKNGWTVNEIDDAFEFLKPKPTFKNKVCLDLSTDIINKLQKRADRNLFTLSEQIEDILRRSVLNTKPNKISEKIDDLLIPLFSRKKRI